uniref:BRCT domain-containing protein n=1 Tax=Steinernema glaseri TaxID=37863 RepID=A0A1I7Z3Z9_9BILA
MSVSWKKSPENTRSAATISYTPIDDVRPPCVKPCAGVVADSRRKFLILFGAARIPDHITEVKCLYNRLSGIKCVEEKYRLTVLRKNETSGLMEAHDAQVSVACVAFLQNSKRDFLIPIKSSPP